MTRTRKLAAIAWQMVPTLDHIIKAGIRVAAGLCLLQLAPLVPEAATKWVEFAGKLFVMLAAITLFSHSEGVFVSHATSKARQLLSRLGWALAGVALMAVSAFTLLAREPHEDEDGLG